LILWIPSSDTALGRGAPCDEAPRTNGAPATIAPRQSTVAIRRRRRTVKM
jgi:hypothetical protein